jgi:hypothetical protein
MLLNHGSLLSCDGLIFQAVLAENEERGSSAASWAASSAAEAPIATALGAVVVRIAGLRRRIPQPRGVLGLVHLHGLAPGLCQHLPAHLPRNCDVAKK